MNKENYFLTPPPPGHVKRQLLTCRQNVYFLTREETVTHILGTRFFTHTVRKEMKCVGDSEIVHEIVRDTTPK